LQPTAILAQERRDMQKARTSGARWPVALALLLATTASSVLAQPGVTVQQLPSSNDPAELLAKALRTLSVEPNNLEALTAAGRNAVVLGDPNAAVGFLGRASQIAPHDGRVKAGLGSALVQLDKPQDALRLFAEASALGVADADIAADRALAYDLTGDPRRAQRDYAIALAANPQDDGVRRNLALSQGISGNRAVAIATLDPLIRMRDIAGWRAQTFVLAMTGDAKGASDITHIMMPSQAEMLQPFLVRLSTLSPADKAKAVHFGEMPAAGHNYTPTELANTGTPATYAPAPAPVLRRLPASVRAAAVQPSDLAPARGALRATAVAQTPAPVVTQPTSAPVRVAAAIPQRKIETNSREAIFALGQPYKVAAPLAGIALGAAPHVSATTPPLVARAPEPTPAPAPTPVPAPASTPPRAVIGPPLELADAQPVLAPPAITTTAIPASTSVAPAPTSTITPDIAATETPQPIPMPGETTGGVGHFDLPHDAAGHARTVSTKVVSEPPRSMPKPAEPVPRLAESAPRPMPVVAGEKVTAKPSRKRPAEDPRAQLPDGPPDDAMETKAPGKSRTTLRTKALDREEHDTVRAKVRSRGKASDNSSDTASADRPTTKSTRSGRKQVADDADTPTTTGSILSRKGRAADRASAKSKAETKTEKSPAERVYVQIAGGANKADMDKAWSGVKTKAPELMKDRAPSTTPLRATNRLLVGPFKDEAEAQAFVNKMAGKGLSGFTFKSAKGQKVEKLGGGN
jgi:Flp pilus assembly protein TadD